MTRLRELLVAIALVAFGCGVEAGGGAYVEATRTSSAEAERKTAAGDVAGAREALQAALAVPAEGIAPQDARVVRQDLLYRLAMLDLSAGRLAEARRFADEGLALGRGQDVFTANLLVVRGKVFESDGDALSASRDYHDALMLNEQLLGAALGDEGARP